MNARMRNLACLAFLATALAGCGSKAPKFEAPEVFSYPQVTLKIEMAGKSVPNAIVELRAKEGKSPSIVSHYDDDAGGYKFFTIEGQEKVGGVPAGDYAIAVKQGKSKVQIPSKYASLQSSGLDLEVPDEKGVVVPLELTP